MSSAAYRVNPLDTSVQGAGDQTNWNNPVDPIQTSHDAKFQKVPEDNRALAILYMNL